MSQNIFEIFTRRGLRVQTTRGNLGVEDLWSTPLAVLDEAHKGLCRQIREAEDESLLVKKDASIDEIVIKRDMVRYIVEVRQAEAAEAQARAARRAQAARVREILAQRQDKDLVEKPTEELNSLLSELEA